MKQPPGSADSAARSVSLDVRRRPVQERGIARFQEILAAARALLMERGLEGFVLEDVADRAGVPIGSVYQYFPNKFSVVAELATQDQERIADGIAGAAELFPSHDWQQLVDALIDRFAVLWAHDPSRSAVWVAMRSTAATRELAAQHSRETAALLRPLIAVMNPALSEVRRAIVAETVVETCQSLLHFSVHDGRPNPAAVEELKRMLRAYLRSVILSH